ncbi:transcriptional regulator [Saliphagus sp. GCM10025334]
MEPSEDIVTDIRNSWEVENDAFGRVYEAILGISEFTRHDDIAEVARCAPNTAKKHLRRLNQMGITEFRKSGRALMFRRNDAYLEWREVTQIAKDHSIQDLAEWVRELEVKEAELKEEFGVEEPDTASVYRSDSDRPIHELMQTIGTWNGIQRDIRLYEAARQLQQNDGRLISAFVDTHTDDRASSESQ